MWIAGAAATSWSDGDWMTADCPCVTLSGPDVTTEQRGSWPMRRMAAGLGLASLTAVLAIVGAGAAHAQTSPNQTWPNKPVRIVAPFAPGGAADTLGRIIAEPLS